MNSPEEEYTEITDKAKRLEAVINLCKDIGEKEKRKLIPFNDFLYMTSQSPKLIFRNIFQLFHDMIHSYIIESKPDGRISDENVHFVDYDCSNIFVKDCDEPFFADKLFSYRFVQLVKGFKKGIQNNRIYLFEGPPGSGKSTFLNNLLTKLEDFTKTPEGAVYKTYWLLDLHKLGGYDKIKKRFSRLAKEIKGTKQEDKIFYQPQEGIDSGKYLEISCPNRDHPILQIPKSFRRKFLDELISDQDFKKILFNSKEFEWVFNDIPCSICNSIFNTLLDRLNTPNDVFDMIYARRTSFKRQFGKGISVYNPGDEIISRPLTNPPLQNLINEFLKTDDVRYLYSDLALTNNGVLVLMDIKEKNIERLLNLHGIISDGVHKVELVEERIMSLFMGILNPEDRKHFESVKSFQDRIITVNIPYILDYNTEVSIYMNKFGADIHKKLLPRVLENFAKIIISTRLNKEANAIRNWINPEKYKKHLDKYLLLLKMELYSGKLPAWIQEDDSKKFDKATSKAIFRESETEGHKGISGRQSLNIFSSFFVKYAKRDKLVTMEQVKNFFMQNEQWMKEIPEGFIDSLESLYDFNVLQEVKEAIYYFNETQISNDILNYLYAINFELGEKVKCVYTEDEINVSEDFFKDFEALFLGSGALAYQRKDFRKNILNEYITKTLSQEIRIEGKLITETEQFQNLFDRFIANLKENALAPYIHSDTFRRAISDFGSISFNSHDERMKRDVMRLIHNLMSKFQYSQASAREISLYILDKGIAAKY